MKEILIIIPTYNSEHFIERTLKSIFSQTGDFDILIIDDNSSDQTVSKVRKFGVSIISKPKNLQRGAGISRNLGFSYCTERKYKYVMWFDSDDIMLENNIINKFKILESNDSIDFVLSPQQRVNSNLDVKGSINNIQISENTQLIFDYYIGKVAFYSQSTMWRVSSLLKNNLIWSNSSIDDWDFNMQAIYCGLKFQIINEVYVLYVYNENSVMRRHQKYNRWEILTELKLKRQWYKKLYESALVSTAYKNRLLKVITNASDFQLKLNAFCYLMEYFVIVKIIKK